MWINLRIRGVPITLVGEMLGRNIGSSTRTCQIIIPYDTESKFLEVNSVWPTGQGIRDRLGVYWSKNSFPEILVPTDCFVEKVVEQTNEGSAPKFSLHRWGVQRSVPSMRRRLEEGTQSSSNQERSSLQMDLPSSILSESGTSRSPQFRSLRLEPETSIAYTGNRSWTVSADEAGALYTIGRSAQLSEPEPAPQPTTSPSEEIRETNDRLLREAESIRQRWAQQRERMEAEGISISQSS